MYSLSALPRPISRSELERVESATVTTVASRASRPSLAEIWCKNPAPLPSSRSIDYVPHVSRRRPPSWALRYSLRSSRAPVVRPPVVRPHAVRPQGESSRGEALAQDEGLGSPRAHSSIGQSPRLITGLFLVRTQVGPQGRVVRPALSVRGALLAPRCGSRSRPRSAPSALSALSFAPPRRHGPSRGVHIIRGVSC